MDVSIRLKARGQKCVEVITLILILSGVVMIGFSLDHDSKWNAWVDSRFNLNLKNSQHGIRINDYITTASQQEWIDLISRNSRKDKLFFMISIFSAYIIVVYISACNKRDANVTQGIILYTVAAISMLIAASLLVSSLNDTESDEMHAVKLLENMERHGSNGTLRKVIKESEFEADFHSDISDFDILSDEDQENKHREREMEEQDEQHRVNPMGEMQLSQAEEVGKNIKKDVFCHGAGHVSSTLKHCQLYTVKLGAIICGFISVIGCSYVALVNVSTWWSNNSDDTVTAIIRISQEVEDALASLKPNRDRDQNQPKPPQPSFEDVNNVNNLNNNEVVGSNAGSGWQLDMLNQFRNEVYHHHHHSGATYQPHVRSAHDDDYQ